MGTLTFVRHGQARPFESERDRLSEVGEVQARTLGRYWLGRNVGFGEVYSGLLVRQRSTADIVGDCFAGAGVAWPRVQSSAALNEFDSEGIINTLIPSLAERDREFRALVDDFKRHRTAPDRNRHFQTMIEAATTHWMRGSSDMKEIESWRDFSARVRGVLREIASATGKGRRVVAFTSGGVIAVAVQTALGAADASALPINWRVRNCSVTEFTFGGGRLSLDSFNGIAHLNDIALQTYR